MDIASAGFSHPATSGYGARGSVLAGAAQVREKLDLLTRQTASGRVSDTFAGLGAGAATSLSLRPAITRIEAFQANGDAVQGRMDVARSSLEQISAIAAEFRARTADLNGLSEAMVDSVAAGARDALRTVADLLNARYGDQYVFAGQDSARAPVPNSDAILQSGFYTDIAAAVDDLAVNGPAATIAATLATAGSNAPGTSPFSESLSQPAATLAALADRVPVGEGRSVAVGIMASANAAAVSGGDSTTGSYIRDILRGLATLGALDSGQMHEPGFAELVADTRGSLEGAITALNVDAGVLGDRQAAIRDGRARLEETITSLRGQVSNVEDVDMAETLSRLSLAQTQLQASYQLLAGLQSLSLTKFLSAG
jgi:flagellar hook-associated protein 3 FlgL